MSWTLVIILLKMIYFQAQVTEVDGKKGFGPGEQDWGHIQVRQGAHMFWWLYYVTPQIKSPDFNVFDKPLLIWLQGGPGSPSSGYGNFMEFGPLNIDLQKRNHTWVNNYNVLFIDSPVGTGFSYVENDSLYNKNNTETADDLVKCISKFLDTIPGFKNVSTYVLGESYGGKIAVEFALTWYKAQENKDIISNLQGIALGSPWISPIDSIYFSGVYLLNIGMLDPMDYQELQLNTEEVESLIEKQRWIKAFEKFSSFGSDSSLLNIGDVNNIMRRKTLINSSHYNYISKYRNPMNHFPDFSELSKNLASLMNNDVKVSLNVSTDFLWVHLSPYVFFYLAADFLKPATHTVERLLNETNLKVIVYNGQLDPVVPSAGTFTWIKKLTWAGAEEWRNTRRVPLVVDNIIEGFVKEHNNLKFYWISRAGHLAPMDNLYAMEAILQVLTSTSN
ncbi:retinoid-inducible serine carboxypeptidase-like [Microplitis mediator]|uniref:retinoid-inducible serine carboxypeptidase-like n=1 Tax=Microplitis mediator TaxID=375433 RepID=UPI00255457BD|nr:retinoid-inducible serine carboxypeptidase-like [Microplitis mediator]